MRHFSRSALVAAPPERLLALIADVERYPEFVPWCVGSRILSRDGAALVACLDIRRGMLRTSFTTRNAPDGDEAITMELVDGPFRSLHGRWSVELIRDPAGAALGSRVTLTMRFELANALTAALLEPLFEETVASLVEAFVARARATQTQERD